MHEPRNIDRLGAAAMTFQSFHEVRFEDRTLLPNEPPGEAFQRFLTEYFERSAVAGVSVQGFSANGRDGAIDIVRLDAADRTRTVIEAKFHGKTRADPAAADWRAVARHLKDNLPALCEAPIAAAGRSPYFPWVDQKRPIAGYVFCTSATFAHENEAAQLVEEIARVLADLSALHPRLAHLKNITVEAWDWRRIQGLIEPFPALRYRWFGGLPRWLRPLARHTGQAESFRRFLDADHLPYFDSAKFAAARNPGQARTAPTVDELLDRLLSNPRGALLIGGAGGLGKTRLALEVARAGEQRGLLAVAAERFADEATLQQLAQTHSAGLHVLVLIDYAEVFDNLGRMAAAVDQLSAFGHHIHLIATCRNSALSRVGTALRDLAPDTLLLDDLRARGDETSYLDWVVEEILRAGEIAEPQPLAQLCRGLPVLAAFAVYLHRESKTQFDVQFSNLATVTTFEAWADARLRAGFGERLGDGQGWARQLAGFAARLPLTEAELRVIRDANDGGADLLETLEADQWFEREGQAMIAAHDVFPDAIVGHYLFEPGKPSHARAGNLLADALSAGALGRALIALDRLADHRDAERLQIAAQLRELRRLHPAALASQGLPILRSRLLSLPDKIALIAEDETLQKALAETPAADLSLSFLADAVVDSKDPVLMAAAQAVLAPLLFAACARPQPTNLILRHAFDLAPNLFRQATLDQIERDPTDHQTHYLIVTWLQHGFPADEIASHMRAWLGWHCRRNAKASFVLKAWMAAGSGVMAVANDVRVWLNHHRATAEAQFVLAAWMDAGGGTAAVADQVRTWLNQHKTTFDARFILKAWMDAGGGTEAVADDVRAWLDHHKTAAEASFVLAPWLDAGGSAAAVTDDVRAWLDCHKTAIETQFVFKAWMDAGGGTVTVADDVRTWLDHHKSASEAGFVLKAWMDAGGRTAAVADDVHAWLGFHKTAVETQFVFKAWMDAGGGTATVADDLRTWLDHHKTAVDAQFVLTAWMDAGGGTAAVAGDVRTWLDHHKTSIDAQYVLAAWMDAGGGTAAVADDVRVWLEANLSHPPASFVLKAWFEAGGDFDTMRELTFEWLSRNRTTEDAVYVTKFIVKQPDLPLPVIVDIVTWCDLHPHLLDAICRIRPLLKYAKATRSRQIVSEVAIQAMEHLDEADIDDLGVAYATFASLARVAGWSPYLPPATSRLPQRIDALHARFILDFRIYARHPRATPRLVRQPKLIFHVSHLLKSGTLHWQMDREPLAEFTAWLAAWPTEELLAEKAAIIGLSYLMRNPSLVDRLGLRS